MSNLSVKAIFLPEDLKGEDINGTAPASSVSHLEEPAEGITYIVLQSGRFAAVKQASKDVEAAFAKALTSGAPVLDFTSASLSGDDVRQRLAVSEEAEHQRKLHDQRVIKRWLRLEDSKSRKKKHKNQEHLSEADIRGIKILKERIKQRQRESIKAKRAARRAVVEKAMFGFGRAINKVFSGAAKPGPVQPPAVPPSTDVAAKADAPAPAPKA